MVVSVVGFDVGSLTSYVAVARGGGIETITNEYSDRNTPTCVAFSGRQRLIGTSAKLQNATNVRNTFTGFIPLIGKKTTDPAIAREKTYLTYAIDSDPDGRILIQANYCDEQLSLYPEQLIAMQLTKLKAVTESALGSKVVDVVINVPTYYSDTERRALLDSSRVAGLNCVKLVNDLTAVATAYGLYNADLPPPDKPSKHVAFVSVGYTSTQLSICAFNAGKVKVISSACDSRLGGRDFDFVLIRKFADEFQAKCKVKIYDSPKAMVRLAQECEKIKKAMSANSQELPVRIECLLGDHDLDSRIKRADFEELSSELLSRFEKLLERCLSLSKLGVKDIQSVELVGGSSRVPALKSLVTSVFKQEGRTTLNADEAVARGCALQAAICSPAYKVREFSVTEACPYGITLYWDREDSGDQVSATPEANDGEVAIGSKDTSIEVFPFLHGIPCSRRFTFQRRAPFTLEARYSNPSELPNENVSLGTFRVDLPQKSGELIPVRVKVRINAHGIFSLSQAEIAEEYEKEVEVEEPEETEATTDDGNAEQPASTPMETNIPENGDATMDTTSTAPSPQETSAASTNVKAKPVMKKKIIKKKAIRYKALPIEANIMQFSTQALNNFLETEGKLCEQDEMEQKRAHAKNSVEEYVYDMRNKLSDQFSPFIKPIESGELMKALNDTEDWLYGDGEDLHRQAYVDRLNEIKSLGDPIEFRACEHKNRGIAVQQYEQALVHFRKIFDSLEKGEATFDHLTEEQLNQLRTTLTQYDGWLRTQMNAQNAKAMNEDPCLRSADILSQLRLMENICNPIMNTPKPTAPPPPAPSAPENNGNTNKTPEQNNCTVNNNTSGKGNKGVKSPTKAGKPTATEKPENMDVD